MATLYEYSQEEVVSAAFDEQAWPFDWGYVTEIEGPRRMNDYKEKIVDGVIEDIKRDLNEYNDWYCLYRLLYDNVDIKILEQYLPENEYNELKAKEQVA